MKKLLLCFVAVSCSFFVIAQTASYTEQYRPQFHFSPAVNWCNDPNGLVYNNGTYHLFYQHNPFGNVWGHMTWAHATSTDLVHWKHMPIAIPEENGVMIFSGSCVVDKNNTSGFGKNGKAPMVAVYTGHIEGVNQSQHIAYSLDDGVTWTKYSGNPVLDLHKKDFRDPKVFWYGPKKYWVMCLMFPVEHMVQFYSSTNLKDWKHLSDFGPAGDTSGVWECPDLTQVPVQGMPGKKKWLLQMSMNASMQYFVGEFDGVQFKNENSNSEIVRPDYGTDYYAAIAYNQLPASRAPAAIGWINNWNYANDIPTTPWKGAMSLPRTLNVRKENGQWILIQQPVEKLKQLRQAPISIAAKQVDKSYVLPVKSQQFEMELVLQPGISTNSGVKIAAGNNNYFEIGYDAKNQLLYTDRSHTNNSGFNENYKKIFRSEKKLAAKNGKIKLHIYFDNSIAEIFVNDGEEVFTSQFFPAKEDNGVILFSDSGETIFSNIHLWKIQPAWHQ